MTDVSRRPVARRPNGRHQLVLRAAIDVIATRGAEQTRYRDVAEASGVPIATLQYMFGSLEALIIEALVSSADAYRRQTRELLAAIESPAERMQLFVDRNIGTPDADRRRWRVWIESWYTTIRDPSARAQMAGNGREWEEMLVAILRDGRDDGSYRGDLDPEEVAIQIYGLVDGLGIALILHNAEPDPRLRRLLIDAIERLTGWAGRTG